MPRDPKSIYDELENILQDAVDDRRRFEADRRQLGDRRSTNPRRQCREKKKRGPEESEGLTGAHAPAGYSLYVSFHEDRHSTS